MPSAVQGIFSILCIVILPFIPEPPRWLANVGRREEALTVIAQTYANGDESDVIVLAQYKQIVDTIHYEREIGETLSLNQLVKTPAARKRITLAVSVAVFSTISGEENPELSLLTCDRETPGNVIASYYLGTMLNNAAIVDLTSQLQIILNYPIRANGMGIFTFVLNGTSLLCVFSFPFALEAISYKAYLVNGAWDVLEIVVIWFFWVETSGKTLRRSMLS
ncbi:hypothetical protein DL95DRAFT_404457 [Leptodontidium sp. 2 PMI_412]|nr:hypothetical protein DL95DRAFT_404457 [Leptodontidium sp. 2 PMI_412]